MVSLLPLQTRIGTAKSLYKPHHLVGDNAGGYEKDLNESLLPSNYTPRFTGEEGNAPPQGNTTSALQSAYHKIHIQPMQRSASDPPVNEAPALPRERSIHFTKGGAFEMFDIIDNDKVGDSYIFIVQPSKREEQCSYRALPTTVDFNDCTYFTIEYVQSTVRISSMEVNDSGMGRYLIMEGQGIMTDVSDQTVSYAEDGSRDSHIVKEIQPGAPVVSVTLGGPGQGAVNTKPSWDPATLSRVGLNTRHACAVTVVSHDSTAGTITVQPLNNKGRLANWGTYCFPATGRIYLANGANAEYDSKTGTTFTFTAGADKYILANGRRATDFADWITSTGFSVESLILLDPQFDTSSVCSDGTTVNDRLFQSISSVQHDYQLGSQYASTRALVEIPLFPNQFFEDRDAGIFPGPDNSMKLHLDATMTAQAWNPSPVGRPLSNYPANDYEAFGHYQYASANNLPIRSQIIDINRFAANTIVLDTNHIANSKFDDFATVKGLAQE